MTPSPEQQNPPPDRGSGGGRTVEQAAKPLVRERLHERLNSISGEIVVQPFVRGVISDVHAAGNDRTSSYSAACGRRNSLQEGFGDKMTAAGPWVRRRAFFGRIAYFFSFRSPTPWVVRSTMLVRANRATALGMTMRKLNMSVRAHTRSLEVTVPRKMNTRAIRV